MITRLEAEVLVRLPEGQAVIAQLDLDWDGRTTLTFQSQPFGAKLAAALKSNSFDSLDVALVTKE